MVYSSIKEKLVYDYWSAKIKNNVVVENHPQNELCCIYDIISESDASAIIGIAGGNILAEFTILLSIYSALIQRFFDENAIVSYEGQQSEDTYTVLYNCDKYNDSTLKQYIKVCKSEVLDVYKHSRNYKEYLVKEDFKFNKYSNFSLCHTCDTVKSDGPNKPFTLIIQRYNKGYKFEIKFDEYFVGAHVAKQFLTNTVRWVKDIGSYINEPVGLIPLLSDNEREALIKLGSGQVSKPLATDLVALLSQQARVDSEQVALIFEDTSFTYNYILNEANILANYLIKEYDACPDCRVGVKLKRDEKLIISLIAVLKSGAAYVPLDINYPEERISYIQQDSECTVIIDDQFLADYSARKHSYSSSSPEVKIASTSLAYIIYTSGSTGQPKGVMISHGNAAELVHWADSHFDAAKFDKVYASTSHCFDLSIFEIFYPLSSGITVRLLDNALEITNYLKQEDRVLLNTVPTVTRSIIENSPELLDRISVLNMAGEVLPADLIRKLPLDSMEVRNLYGPSEDTTYSTCYTVEKKNHNSIPIGRPVYNTKAYILDDKRLLLPIGVTGKLYLSGASVAQGYLNRPELSSEKFISDPFVEGDRMYDTGDLARWAADGNLEFMGRKDNQVKLNGYRIELGEIENRLAMFSDAIKQVVVDVRAKESHKILVAYYVADTKLEHERMIEYLGKYLPNYFVPQHFLKLQTIPLTPNGKVNRKALPEIENISGFGDASYIAPRNETEAKLAAIWQEVLELNNLGVEDDFFGLGGHSLLLTKLSNEYQRVFNQVLDLQQIYKNTTIAAHAALLNNKDTAVTLNIEEVPSAESYILSPSQTRYWLLHNIRGKTKEFNIYSTLALPADLNVECFERAFNKLLERHEGLRTVFVEHEGMPFQKIVPHQSVSLLLRSDDAGKVEEEIFGFEFDLNMYPLYKVALVNDRGQYLLHFNVHHSISDGWSIGIIKKELIELYQAEIDNRTPDLSTLNITYKDYAYWQNNVLDSDLLQLQQQYWTKKLAGELPYLQLPLDYARTNKSTIKSSASYTAFLSSELKAEINKLCKDNRISSFAFFVSTLKILLNKITGEADVITGIPVANRTHYQLKDMVGCFLNTLMLRDEVQQTVSFHDFLTQVSDNLIDALANQNYPIESLLDDLKIPKETNRFPISSVFINMLDFEAKAEEEILDFSPTHAIVEATPKFDFECYFKSYANGYELKCVYDSSLFSSETIAYWINEYLSIVQKVVENSSIKLYDLKLGFETKEVTPDPAPETEFLPFSSTEIQKGIISRFEAQVKLYPNQLAVFSGNSKLTYQELNNAANTLGSLIRKEVSGNSKRVALLMRHDESSVIGMLGALKAGCSYVPIDAEAPLKRIEFIIQDSNSAALVCTPDTYKYIQQLEAPLSGLPIVTLMPQAGAASAKVDNLNIPVNPQSEAYVLYTSGSTGKPKGVIQSQRNVLHYIRVYTNNVHISSNDVLSLFSTYTFDASVKDIYASILNGATLGIYNIQDQGLHNLQAWVLENGISIMHMVPTLYRHFTSALEGNGHSLKSVRAVDLGGEPCIPEDFYAFKNLFPRQALLINDYGPTEATIVSQKFLSHTSVIKANAITLGKAVNETEVFLINEDGERCGVYQEGEITFKSDYLSSGYLKREAETKRAFTFDTDGKPIYKSGDIGKLLPNGEIVFLHRKDTQIKLNGVRIELTEIESQLKGLPGIEEAVVMLRQVNGNERLIAYVRTITDLDLNSIKSGLSLQLPRVMIPSMFVFIESFPLTRTGKIDRKMLPIPEVYAADQSKYIAPEGEIEERLVSLWADALRIPAEEISVIDNFFELGGNSLQIMILINKINKEYTTRLMLENLYHTLTVKDLADLIKFSLLQRREKVDASQETEEIIL